MPGEEEKMMGFHLCVLVRKGRQGSDTHRRLAMQHTEERCCLLINRRNVASNQDPGSHQKVEEAEDCSAVKALRL